MQTHGLLDYYNIDLKMRDANISKCVSGLYKCNKHTYKKIHFLDSGVIIGVYREGSGSLTF